MHTDTPKRSITYNRTHLTDHGYTCHGFSRNFSGKHLPCFNFISIACPEPGSGNGRVYDPQVGAFLSPDPFVQAPFNTQSYNRYAYVFNNPMKYVDPSGYITNNIRNEMRSDGVQWIINGAYNSDYARISKSFGAGGSSNPYSYNWITRRYENSAGEEVPYWEVHNNYIIPNASAIYKREVVGGWAVESEGTHIDSRGVEVYSTIHLIYEWKEVVSSGGHDWFNNAFIVNSGLGSGSGIFAGNYGLTANQTFKYGVRQGGKIISASQRTAIHFSHSMNVAKTLGRVNIITGTIGVAYSTNQAISDYNEGGWNQVNRWDVIDAFLGAGGVTFGGLAMLGIVSNPVGWAVGIGTGLYFGGRLMYDLATTKN